MARLMTTKSDSCELSSYNIFLSLCSSRVTLAVALAKKSKDKNKSTEREDENKLYRFAFHCIFIR